MIVEIQLHVRDLFTLKADLHVLYAGMRVLGATEDLMVKHEGVLTDEVLKRAERGVLRKLGLNFSPMTIEQAAEIPPRYRRDAPDDAQAQAAARGVAGIWQAAARVLCHVHSRPCSFCRAAQPHPAYTQVGAVPSARDRP